MILNPLFLSTKIKVGDSTLHGRGVFAIESISSGEIIEECHFIKLFEKDFIKLDKSIRDISFGWPIFNIDTHAIVLGFGSIYCDDGKIVNWVCNFNNSLQNEVIYLQPGKYKVVYRYGFEKETTKTIEQNFEVKSGTPKTIRLF